MVRALRFATIGRVASRRRLGYRRGVLRSAVIVLGLAVVAPLAADVVVATAIAQPHPSGYAPPEPPPPESVMRQREQLTARPSGFWTSNRPAVGGAYRWRMLGMGALVLAITAFFVVRLLRKISAARPALPTPRATK